MVADVIVQVAQVAHVAQVTQVRSSVCCDARGMRRGEERLGGGGC